MYMFRELYIPDRMMPGIRRYVEDGIRPSQFLTAIIQNNLSEACSRADDENIHNLPAYVAYFYNKAPSDCWGSKEKMIAWMDLKRGENLNE